MTIRAPVRFCRNCGTAVEYRVPDDGDTRVRAVCPACHTIHYENPLNVVGTIPVMPDGRVLLCKRNIEPRWGKWTLPAGFMELGETAEQGAARETDEEAGALITMGPLFSLLSVPQVGQVHIFYLATVLSERARVFKGTPGLLSAGFLSGFMNAIAGIGGPGSRVI